MTTAPSLDLPATVIYADHKLSLLDQRRLPQEITYLDIATLPEAHAAIATLAVRGAPAIGVAAAYALALSMRDQPAADFSASLTKNARYLASARPTAVNLQWAISRLGSVAHQRPSFAALLDEAGKIHREDQALCAGIGEHGAELLWPGCRVLTHCNAGALATTGIGTATAPIYRQHQRGMALSVYADETRPLYQGARLTAWELQRAGVAVHLLCDNAAATLMAQGGIDLVLVGTDRVTRNGDVVNKVGTLNLAILCHHFAVPFYVACPSSTLDPDTPDGGAVVIEQRDPLEVRGHHAAEVNTINPAFDVTPNHLVTGLLTERGIARTADERDKLFAALNR